MHSCELCGGRGLVFDEQANAEYDCQCRPALIAARRAAARRYAALRQAGARVRGEKRSQRRPSRAKRRAETPCHSTGAFVSDEELERRWTTYRASQGKRFNRRAFNTRLVYYALLRRWAFKEGSTTFELTNENISAGLAKAGRERQRRTAQYVMREFEALGLVKRWHVVRGGPTRGYKDTIRVRMMPASYVRRQAHCTPPPSGRGSRSDRPDFVGKNLSPPPSAADDDPRPTPAWSGVGNIAESGMLPNVVVSNTAGSTSYSAAELLAK